MPGMLCPDTTHAAVLSRGGSCTCQPMRDPCAAAGWAAAHAGGGPGTGRTRWEGESGPAGGMTLPEKRVKTGCLVLVCSAVPLGMPWGVAEGTGRSVAPDRHQARGGARHRCPCPCAQVMPWTVVVSLWMCTVLQALTVSSAAGGDGTGCAFSVVQKLLASAAVQGNSHRREGDGQRNVWYSGGEWGQGDRILSCSREHGQEVVFVKTTYKSFLSQAYLV